MENNARKNKTMHITKGIQKRLSIEWQGEKKEEVEEMIEYLNTIIRSNGKIDTETNNRGIKANWYKKIKIKKK